MKPQAVKAKPRLLLLWLFNGREKTGKTQSVLNTDINILLCESGKPLSDASMLLQTCNPLCPAMSPLIPVLTPQLWRRDGSDRCTQIKWITSTWHWGSGITHLPVHSATTVYTYFTYLTYWDVQFNLHTWWVCIFIAVYFTFYLGVCTFTYLMLWCLCY